MKGKKINFKIEKPKKNRMKMEKKSKANKTNILDFKVRFNILTFLTYACRYCDSNKTIFVTNC